MQISILTLPLHTNYGGILQAYALQTILERMGHQVILFDIDRHLSLPFYKMPFAYAKRILKKILGRKCDIFYEQKRNREYPIISQHTQRFIDTYIHQWIVTDWTKLNAQEFDAIVVGSDQVWRPIYFRNRYWKQIENAFLYFANDWPIKRIAYAPSFGTDCWEYTEEETKICGTLLKRFDAVSVREQSAVGICKEKFGVEALHVLDPTMLLSASDYIALFEKVHAPKSNGNLLCYILDETPEKSLLIERIAQEKDLVPFAVNSLVENPKAALDERIQPSVEKWLRGFYDADFVVTDSFHACVFSIIFRKPFVVYGNESRGMARFQSLLSIFGLEDRLIYKLEQYKELPPIDYEKVVERLETMQKRSMEFLQQGLES